MKRALMMKRTLSLVVCLACIGSSAVGQVHVIGWQTFDNAGADNNSGITDNTPDTNSTFDATPTGANNNGTYLSGSIGPDASNSGWDGFGQSTDNQFLNGSTFGNNSVPPGLNIEDWALADGSPGMRIGPFGQAGASSWKFSSQNSNNQLLGDFSITNESDYYFRLERIHFDARALGGVTSADTLELRYLATPGNLINVAFGSEVQDQKVFYSNTWTERGVENVSPSISDVIGSAARLAPGDKASFRFLWSRTNTSAGQGQTQIDNLAFSGTFLDQDNSFAEVDPTADGSSTTFDCAGIDAITAEIAAGTNNLAFDLTGDGLVDLADRDSWLAQAGAANNGSGGAYLLGDANLDGFVDVSDLNIWSGNKFSSTAAWCSGDFNADGFVDVSDLNVWSGNKFQSSDSVAAVPEPSPFGLILVSMAALLARRRRSGIR